MIGVVVDLPVLVVVVVGGMDINQFDQIQLCHNPVLCIIVVVLYIGIVDHLDDIEYNGVSRI